MYHPNYNIRLEEIQVVTILKSLMSTAEEYIGDINTVNLSRKDPDKSYTEDGITIKGFMEDGRPYTLQLDVGDKP